MCYKALNNNNKLIIADPRVQLASSPENEYYQPLVIVSMCNVVTSYSTSHRSQKIFFAVPEIFSKRNCTLVLSVNFLSSGLYNVKKWVLLDNMTMLVCNLLSKLLIYQIYDSNYLKEWYSLNLESNLSWHTSKKFTISSEMLCFCGPLA